MKNFKRVLSIILVIVLAMSTFPFISVAEEVSSGTCGENLTWMFDDNATITISGTGDMEDYNVNNHYNPNPPWYNINNIETVIIKNGVTSIGDRAFSCCYNLTNVTIPDSVTSIGDSAFGACSVLESITIPDSVTHIGAYVFTATAYYKNESNWENGALYINNHLISAKKDISGDYIIKNGTLTIAGCAFKGCNRFTDISIPDSVTSIGKDAFNGCSNLKSITIPSNVINIGIRMFQYCSNLTNVTLPNSITNIDVDAFYGCDNLISITVNKYNSGLYSENGILFNKTKTKLLKYPAGKNDTSYTIPNSVTHIGSDAFYACSNLTSVTIGNNVTHIGSGAFWNCSNLKVIYIPKSVTAGVIQAFYGCTSLSDVYYSGNQEDWESRFSDEFDYSGCLSNATIHYNSQLESQPDVPLIDQTIQFGSDRFSFGKDMSGYVGEEIRSLLVYTSKDGNIASLNITSSNTDVVEIGTIEIGVGDYITTLENEHIATIPLKLKAEGTSTITITSPEGISENINVTVSKVPEVKKSIAIFSTEKSLTLKAGECMWLAFGLMNNKTGLVEENWNKMAVVVSDPSVVALSDYEETEYGYSLEVTGKKEGSTNLTITDTLSGTSTVITVTVYDNYIRSYSYAINDMQEFYPDTKHEKDIKTNIYNLNGLYVNNYACIPEFYENEFQVSFDVYNSQYYNGAVDIYDADGVWIDCEYIDRYSDITSLRDTGEQLFYLITDAANKRLLSYQSASFSKKTSINIKVPKGGYFTISNNMADSPGTFFANAFEILYDTTSDLIDFATSKASDKTAFDKFYKDATKSFAQNVIDARNETLSGEAKKKAMEVALSSLTSEIKKIQKKFVSSEAKDFVMNGNEMYSAISTLAENILNSYSINWKHLYQSTTGVAESMFIKFSGPAGVALKGMFAITKGSNKLLMAAQMSRSLDNTYATIYSSIDEGYINPHGIVVNTNGNVDSEAVLQVFKVSDNDTLEVVLNSANPLEKYELYNICFVKDDKLVQPSGKVKVHVPIPEGMNRNTCKIYRQESDDSWTILDAHIEENYLVFETDHFSLYSVIGDMEKLSISSLPNKNIYKEGDVLDTSGLALKLNDQTISRGFICEPTVLSEIGLQTITVKYGYAITEFTVNVVSSASYNINGIINSFGDIGDTVTVKLLQGTAEINSMQTASGSYHFADVAAGTYTLEISKPNHVTRTYKIVLNDTDVTQDVTIYLFGDLHVDGVVTASDALMALQAATGKITLTEEQQAAADVNGDESVAAGDALLILQYATRKIAQFPKAA